MASSSKGTRLPGNSRAASSGGSKGATPAEEALEGDEEYNYNFQRRPKKLAVHEYDMRISTVKKRIDRKVFEISATPQMKLGEAASEKEKLEDEAAPKNIVENETLESKKKPTHAYNSEGEKIEGLEKEKLSEEDCKNKTPADVKEGDEDLVEKGDKPPVIPSLDSKDLDVLGLLHSNFFRKVAEMLEHGVSPVSSRVSALETEVASLKAENLRLREQVAHLVKAFEVFVPRPNSK